MVAKERKRKVKAQFYFYCMSLKKYNTIIILRSVCVIIRFKSDQKQKKIEIFAYIFA